jgi:hypothetical protein
MADGTDADWGLAGPLALRLDPRGAPTRAPAEGTRWRRGVQAGVVLLHAALLMALIEAMALRDGPPARDLPGPEVAPLVIEFDLTGPLPALPQPAVDANRDAVPAREPDVSLASRATVAPTVALIASTPRPSAPVQVPEMVVADMPRQDSATPPSLDTTRLFDAEGRPRLSQSVLDAAARADAAPAPQWRERVFVPSPQFQPRRSTVPYAPTRFDRAWVADRETLGQELMRRSIVSRKVKTPWGTVWQCGGSLFLPVLVGCADVPPRPLERPPAGPGEAPRTPQHAVPGRDPLGD